MLATKTDEFSFLLKPSTIEGVGVFAAHNIKQGTRLRLFWAKEMRVLKKVAPQFRRYGIKTGNLHHYPQNFGRMSIGCYLNHSTQPNAFHKDYIYYASRAIKKGEEILIDYGTL